MNSSKHDVESGRLSSFGVLLAACSLLFLSYGSNAIGDELIVDPLISQPPLQLLGSLSVAEPVAPVGNWRQIHRPADEFKVAKDTEIGSVAWWGGSSDGRHGRIDSVSQVLGFAIEIYSSENASGFPEKLLQREIVTLNQSNPEPTKHILIGGSKVHRFSTTLSDPLPIKADHKYWISISAYLGSPTMWVWCMGKGSGYEAATDLDVNGAWEPMPHWHKTFDLAFELYPPNHGEKVKGPDADKELASHDEGLGEHKIQTLIDNLGSAKFTERVQAESTLLKLGMKALPFLKKNIEHENEEVRARVRRILGGYSAVSGYPRHLLVRSVEKGEDLEVFSKRFSVPREQVLRVNALGERSIFPGMQLRVPLVAP